MLGASGPLHHAIHGGSCLRTPSPQREYQPQGRQEAPLRMSRAQWARVGWRATSGIALHVPPPRAAPRDNEARRWIHLGERALFARRRALHGRCQFGRCLRSTVYGGSSLHRQPLAPRECQQRGRRLEAGLAGMLLVDGAVNPLGRAHPKCRAHHRPRPTKGTGGGQHPKSNRAFHFEFERGIRALHARCTGWARRVRRTLERNVDVQNQRVWWAFSGLPLACRR